MLKYRKITDISLVTDTISIYRKKTISKPDTIPILIYRYRRWRYFRYIDPPLVCTALQLWVNIRLQNLHTTPDRPGIWQWLWRNQSEYIRTLFPRSCNVELGRGYEKNAIFHQYLAASRKPCKIWPFQGKTNRNYRMVQFFNDLKKLQTQISRARHYSTLSITETRLQDI